MIKIYHNPRCRKSREGLQLLEASKQKFETVLYLEQPPTTKELSAIIAQLGIEPLELIRKNEAIWKENFRGKELSNQQLIEAMVKHPKLIERPIVIKGNTAVIGRPKENIAQLLQ